MAHWFVLRCTHYTSSIQGYLCSNHVYGPFCRSKIPSSVFMTIHPQGWVCDLFADLWSWVGGIEGLTFFFSWRFGGENDLGNEYEYWMSVAYGLRIHDSQALVVTFSYRFVMSWTRMARFQDRVQISRQKSEESYSVQEYFLHNYEEIINILVVSLTPNSQNCTPST